MPRYEPVTSQVHFTGLISFLCFTYVALMEVISEYIVMYIPITRQRVGKHIEDGVFCVIRAEDLSRRQSALQELRLQLWSVATEAEESPFC
jgi:hypothetical protein